jgi:hypothetical protein
MTMLLRRFRGRDLEDGVLLICRESYVRVEAILGKSLGKRLAVEV